MAAAIPANADYIPRPKLMSSFRRFGRHDKFQPIKSSTSSIGSKSIGNITVDCQLLFHKSQWGILEGLPGGIMYLNLHFGLPQNSKLQEATITIRLDEDDALLQAYKNNPPVRKLHYSGTAVHFADWYGPQTLRGEKKSASVTSTVKLVPEANVLGNGMGGVGYERSTKSTKERRWCFDGQLGRGKRTPSYTTLRWHLKENELEGQSFHNPQIYTAFAFKHSGQPFTMKIEIKGRLQKWQENVQSMLKFGADGAREGKVVTLVDFEDYRKFSRGLDGIARGLPWAMELENLQNVPMELPESIPGISFSQVQHAQSSMPETMNHGTSITQVHPTQSLLPPHFTAHRPGSSPAEARPLLPHCSHSTRAIDMEADTPTQLHGIFPTVDDYRRILAQLSHPKPRYAAHATGTDTTMVNATTVADRESPTEEPERAHHPTSVNTPGRRSEESRSNGPSVISNVDGDTMLRAWWLILWQLVSNMTKFLNLVVVWLDKKNDIQSR